MALHFPSSLERRPHRGVLAEALEGVSVVVVVVCGRGRGVGGDGVGLGVEVAVPAVGRAGRGREGGEAAAVGVRAVSVGDVAWNAGEREGAWLECCSCLDFHFLVFVKADAILKNSCVPKK